MARPTNRPAPVIGSAPLRNPAVTDTVDPDEGPEEPDNWYVFDSSRVREATYDPQHQRLYVLFQKPQPGGTPWTYEGVQPNEWRNFRRSQSPGKFVNRVLNSKNYHRGNWSPE